MSSVAHPEEVTDSAGATEAVSEAPDVTSPSEETATAITTKSTTKMPAAPESPATNDSEKRATVADESKPLAQVETNTSAATAPVQKGVVSTLNSQGTPSTHANTDTRRYGGARSMDEYNVTEFRRGDDNSHVNRMTRGSYSRYLSSCDHVPADTFLQSFYGSTPMISFVQSHASMVSSNHTAMPSSTQSVKGRAQTSTGARMGGSARDRDASTGPQGQHDGTTAHSSMIPHPTADAHVRTGGGGGGMKNAHASSREAQLLDPALYQALCDQRRYQRHDPRHGQGGYYPGVRSPTPHTQKHTRPDTLYVNHHSKNCYLPHDPPPQAVLLRYNDLYDFGSGTRINDGRRIGSAGGEGGMFSMRRNPRAGPPMTVGQWQAATQIAPGGGGAALPSLDVAGTTGGSNETNNQAPQHATWRLRPGQRQLESARKNCTSLRNEYAVNPEKLHVHQHRHMTTIEDVMANPTHMY